MKKITAIIISVILIAAAFAGCKEKTESATELLAGTNLSKYIKLCDYENIGIDTSDALYQNYYNMVLDSDISSGGFYDRLDSGTISDGDIANIDYVGTRNGVAFSGGTAQGYDLEIGSDSFIDGFEDGLIGKEIGDTVELNLKFPENYQNSELAGKAVVFTVTVNYARRPQTPDKYYDKLSFASEQDYIDDLNTRTAKSYILRKIANESNVKKYPDNSNFKNAAIIGYYYNYAYDAFMSELNSKNLTINQYISQNGDSISIKTLTSNYGARDIMNSMLVSYAVLNKNGLTIDKSALSDYTGAERLYHESVLVQQTAAEYLYEKNSSK